MQFSNNPQIEIMRVFLAPDSEPVDEGRSMLYLLRRDLQDQYGKESNSHTGKIISPLLTSLGIMVGFELLTKYYMGKYETESKDIVKFVKDVAKLSANESKILAQLRNALAHGYSLATTNRKGQKYTFRLDENSSKVNTKLIGSAGSEYIINIWELKKLFINSIGAYRSMLDQSTDLEGKFITANANLGELRIVQ